ncbi:hypothetical protein GUJ93_ZPchr0013g35455 [Zizania palustris]|uniref:Uncharacterized protein n=1 Tax=Zizania palustris TaxID=103762 RepID=A0A8J5WUQ4_ZIZPA|nr:hypothetical protein GUJ93_ZPchr0013g35455 [Zizania palustris]
MDGDSMIQESDTNSTQNPTERRGETQERAFEPPQEKLKNRSSTTHQYITARPALDETSAFSKTEIKFGLHTSSRSARVPCRRSNLELLSKGAPFSLLPRAVSPLPRRVSRFALVAPCVSSAWD